MLREVISNITTILERPFPLLDDRRSKVFLVVFSALVSSVFIVVYNPLSIKSFYINSPLGALISVQAAGIIGAVTLILTQFAIRPLHRSRSNTVGSFIIWMILELVLISLVTFLFYAERGMPFWSELLVTTGFAIKIAIGPYIIACMLIALVKQNETDITQQIVKPLNQDHMLSIVDEKGKQAILLESNSILFIKASDNYIEINYLAGTELQKKLVRNSLKRVEKYLPTQAFVRVHRSYIINTNNLHSLNREGRKTEVLMNGVQDPIPVSSKYRSDIESGQLIRVANI